MQVMLSFLCMYSKHADRYWCSHFFVFFLSKYLAAAASIYFFPSHCRTIVREFNRNSNLMHLFQPITGQLYSWYCRTVLSLIKAYKQKVGNVYHQLVWYCTGKIVDVLRFSHYSGKNVFEEQIQLVSLAIILWDVWVFQFVAITVRLNNQTTRK